MDADPSITLGPYRLEAPLARGAAGRVWAARALSGGPPLAVKVLHAAADAATLAAFNNEVRAAAGLEHPGVVSVLDLGVVELAEAVPDQLPLGAPYLVMERVDGLPLHARVGALPWPACRAILFQLLDILAHAHARGVIHRDIKPGNILLVEPPEGPPRVHLTDFGLARAGAPGSDATPVLAGTPAYMAPEQLRGDDRSQGPATDLYSLGCLAWALVTGVPPFGRQREVAALTLDHLHRPPPPLSATIPVPLGLEAWLRRLLEKDPLDRYASAADARAALSGIADGPLLPPAAPVVPLRGADDPSTQDRPAPSPVDDSTPALDPAAPALFLPPEAFPAPSISPAPIVRAALPPSWGPDRHPAGPPAGLRLYGMRPLPLIGRQAARDTLWQALCAADAARRPRVVILRGPPGSGKSRLAEWVCERAHELCGAPSFRAVHGVTPAPDAGLAGLLARALRVEALDRAPMLERVVPLLRAHGLSDADVALAAVECIRPASTEERASGQRVVRPQSPRERHTLLLRILEHLCTPLNGAAPRPAILWLDDVQFGADALAFAAAALDTRRPLPFLIVLTAEEHALVERPSEAVALEGLAERDGVRVIEPGPLLPAEAAVLVRALLPLEAPLVDALVQRAAGNPLFAVQLVGELVASHALHAGPAGGLRADSPELDLPETLHAVWARRVARLCEGLQGPEIRALELAAALGTHVDKAEWHAVCARTRARPDARVLDRLVVQRLARVDPLGAGWSFAHPMLRESLGRAARAAGRAVDHHRACASMLDLRAFDRPGTAERIAGHLLEAGDDRDALYYLLQAAEERLRQGDLALVEALLDRRLRAMARAGVAPEDPVQAAGWFIRLRALRLQGRWAEAEEWTHHALAEATRQGWRHVRCGALLDLAILQRHAGAPDAALRTLSEAEAEARSLGDRARRAACLLEQGRVFLDRGLLEAAAALLREARADFTAGGRLTDQAECDWLLGVVAKTQADFPAALARYSEALAAFEAQGFRWGVASCTNELGEVARYTGDLAAAEAHYRDALHRMEALGADHALVVRLNLALVLQAHGRFPEALALLVPAVEAYTASGDRPMLTVARILSAVSHAAAADWPAFDACFQDARRNLASLGLIEADVALSAARAGELCADAGEHIRANAAFSLARDQWAALGRHAEAGRCAARLDTRTDEGWFL